MSLRAGSANGPAARRRRGSLVAAALLLWIGPAAAADLDSIRDCVRANVPSSIQIQKVKLTAFDRAGGSREMKGRLFATREDPAQLRLMLRLDAPPDVAGSAYLVRERERGQEMYVYVPAFSRVRRVTGSSLDGALFATDFSYGDISQIHRAFDAGSAVLEDAAEIEQRTVDWIAFDPREQQQDTRFDRARVAVDRETCVALRIEFFENGTVVKRYEADPKRLRQVDTHWYAEFAQMRNLKQETHTTLEVQDVSSGDALSNRYFMPMTFHEGP